MTVPEGRIRNATLPEVELIQGIERRAESVFSPTDLPVQIRHGLSSETLARGILNHNLWVSVGNDDVPVGFALTVIYGSDMHLEEISVDPDSSRKGSWKGSSGYSDPIRCRQKFCPCYFNNVFAHCVESPILRVVRI